MSEPGAGRSDGAAASRHASGGADAPGPRPPHGALRFLRRDGGLVVVHAPPAGFRGRPEAAIDAARLLERARLGIELHARCDAWARVTSTRATDGRVEVAVADAVATLAALPAARVRPTARHLDVLVRRLCDAFEAHRDAHGTVPAVVRPRDVLLPARSLAALGRARLLLLTLPEAPRAAGGEPVRRGRRGAPSAHAGAEPRSAPAAAERALLRSVGELLARLVEGRDEAVPVRPPLRDGPAWAAVGRSGSAWRALVDALLDPEPGREPADVAALRAAIPREPRSRRPLAAAAAMLVVGGAIAAGLTLAGERRLDEVEVEQLRVELLALGRAYDRWFDDLVFRVRDDAEGGEGEVDVLAAAGLALPEDASPELQASIALLGDRVLRPVRAAIDAAGAEDPFDPLGYLDGVPAASGLAYASDAVVALEAGPELVRAMLDRDAGRVRAEVQRPILRAATVVRTVADGLRAWRDRDDGARLARALEARGWTAAASRLRAPLPVAADDVPRPDAVIARARRLVAAEQAMKDAEAITEAMRRAAADGGPAAAVASAWAAAIDRAAAAEDDPIDAARLVAAAGADRGEMAALAGDDGRAVAWDAAAAAGLALRPPAGAGLPWFDEWRRRVAPWRRLEVDPRPPRETLAAELDAALADAAEVRRYDAVDRAAAIEAAVAATRSRLDALYARLAIVGDREGLAAAAAAAEREVEAVRARASTVLELVAVPPAAWLAEQRGIRFDHPALQATWDDRLARGERPGRLERAEDYFEFRRGTGALRAMLEQAETSALPPVSAPVSPPFPGFDGEAFAAAGAAVRGALLARAADAIEDTMDVAGRPDPDDPRFAATLDELAAELAAWRRTADAAMADHARLAEAMDRGLGLDEPAAPGITVGELDRRWRPLAAEPDRVLADLAPVLRPVMRRVDRLREIAGAPDEAAVLEAAGLAFDADAGADAGADPGADGGIASPPPERVVAAWRRLVELPVRDPAVRRAAVARLAPALETTLAGLPGARRAALAAERREAGADHWTRVVRAGSSRDDLLAALDAAPAFDVEPAALAPELRWNLLAHRLADDLEALDPEDEPAARARVRRFLDAARPLVAVLAPSAAEAEAEAEAEAAEADGAAATGRADVAAVVADLASLVAGEDARVDFAATGPAAASDWWSYVPDAAGPPPTPGGPPSVLVYRGTPGVRGLDPVELVLRLVPGSPPARPVWLATHEASVALVRTVVRDADLLARVERGIAAGEGARGRAYPGPRTWDWAPPDVVLASAWLWDDIPRRGSDHPPDRTPPRPRETHPFQYLTPTVALMIAAELGCRLPTPEELRSAIVATAGTSDPAALRRAIATGTWPANVRDRSVASQRQWAISVKTERPTVLAFRPELGAFRTPRTDASGPAAAALPFETWPVDDGALWFRPVDDDPAVAAAAVAAATDPDAPPPFRHVVGNVAEIVLAADGGPIAVPPGLASRAVAEAIGPGGAAVMGASALTAPSIDPLEPVVLTARDVRSAPDGWSDVGFRLALAPRGRFTSVAAFAAARSRDALLPP